ncbi:protein kinase [candidate division CSSED10-310 bacterium]|uniref:Protein kinase n=1 Tax=candidate division CSSED10-310 bacterium TaxID=2855610 RepID=A0ABV6YVF4_UNCC1
MNQYPTEIGPYQIDDQLGKGGMGVVYRARHRETGEQVALKTVRITNEAMLRSIRREIHVMARIKHPGVVRIINHGTDKGLPWYAMELLRGETLKNYISRIWGRTETQSLWGTTGQMADKVETANRWWTLSLAELDQGLISQDQHPEPGAKADQTPSLTSGLSAGQALDLKHVFTLFQKLCEPLAYLHGEGIVHRDLKPDNIFIVADDQPVLVDFGLMMQFSGKMRRETLLVEQYSSGTVSYMAPEQIRGEFVDARADIYSLGCILFEILTGQPPFFDEDVTRILNGHLYQDPQPLSSFRQDIPGEIDHFIVQLLAKDPFKRIGYADTVATQLVRFGGEYSPVEMASKPRLYLYRSGFSGRVEQMNMLRKKLEILHQKKSQLVLFSGEAGIGKTRMVMEIGQVASRENVLVLTGACGVEKSLPFEAFRKPLQMMTDRCHGRGQNYTDRIFGQRGKILALIEPSIASLPGQDLYPEPDRLSPPAARTRLFDYLHQTLKQLAQEQSLLCILDDIHLGDELLLEFLEFVHRDFSLEESPILYLATYSEDISSEKLKRFIELAELEVITLTRLLKKDIRTMIGDMLAIKKPPPTLVQLLHQKSGGNPFFVAEFLHVAVETGLLQRDNSGRWSLVNETGTDVKQKELKNLPLPGSVYDILAIRMQDLSPSATTVLKSGAILGTLINQPLLDYMTPLPEAELIDATEELIWKQLLVRRTPDQLIMRLGIMREFVLAQIKPAERQALHHKAARGIETLVAPQKNEYLYSLGDHWEQAGHIKEARTAYHKAGQLALERFAYADAANFFESYLRLVDTVTTESITVRKALAQDILVLLGQSQVALNTMKKSIAEALSLGEEELAAECICALGMLFWRTGDMEKAKDHLEDALTRIQDKDNRKLEASFMTNLATVTYILGDPDTALYLLDQAHQIALDSDDIYNRARILGNKGLMHCEQGNMKVARELFLTSLKLQQALANRQEEAMVFSNLAILERELGHQQEAFRYIQATLDINRQIGNKLEEGIALNHLAGLCYDRGDPIEALELLHKALILHQKVDNKRFQAVTLHAMASLHCGEARYTEAQVLAEQALTLTRDMGDQRLLGWINLLQARISFELGDLAQSDGFFNDASSRGAHISDRRLQGSLLSFQATYHRLITRDLNQAQKVAGQAREIFEEIQNPLDLVPILCSLGHIALARGNSAAALFQLAGQINEQLSDHPHSETNRALANLQKAQTAFEKGDDDVLFQGELLSELPAGLRLKLRNQK